MPFDSERKRMSVAVKDGGDVKSYTKGAPDIILDRCSKIVENGLEVPLTETKRNKIHKAIDTLAQKGYRTLAFSCKKLIVDTSEKSLETKYDFCRSSWHL